MSLKLLAWFLFVALVPLTVVSAISYYTATASLRDAAHHSLGQSVEGTARFIKNWVHYRIVDLESQATNINNAQLLAELREAHKNSGKNLAEFVGSYGWQGTVYGRSEDLRTFRKLHDYNDIYLIDTDGNILFTAAEDDDLGTNLFDGPLAESRFAAACRTTLRTGRPTFSDLEQYAPSGNVIAGFLVNLILDKSGDKIGLFALQLPYARIETAMQITSELTPGTRVYLVGYSSDRDGVTLRTAIAGVAEAGSSADPATVDASNYLSQRVDNEQTRMWFAREHSERTSFHVSFNGEWVLGTHRNVELPGVDWGVIAEIPERIAMAPALRLRNLVVGLLAVTGIFVSVIAFIITRRIVRPITQLSRAADRVAGGDLTVAIEGARNDEIGALAESFNGMIYDLRAAADERARMDWLTTGRAELNEVMQGASNVQELGQAVITFLAEYVGAQVGVFYATVDQQRLEYIGGHAFVPPKELFGGIGFGEGIAGQAAVKREPVLLTEIPDECMVISSGLGRMKPRNILAQPLVRGRESLGVIELGALETFSDRTLAFLKDVSERIAIALEAGTTREELTANNAAMIESVEQTEKARSITEDLNARLAESEARTRAILDSAADAIITIDSDGIVQSFNPAAVRIFGHASSEIIGENISGIIPVSLRAHIRTGESKQLGQAVEVEGLRKNGADFPLELTVDAVGDDQKLFTVIARDITDRKKVEQERQDQSDMMAEALRREKQGASELAAAMEAVEDAKMAAEGATRAKSEFLANMSHEIRTPMTAILGFAETIAENVTSPENVDAIATVRRNGEYLLHLINDILDLSKIESNKMVADIAAHNPCEVIGEVAALVRDRAEGKGLTFAVEYIGDIPETIQTDATRLRQILINLLGNAIKFTENGGIKLISRLVQDGDEPHMQFDVLDTGVGLTKEQVGRLFQPFMQAHNSTTRKFGGTGLGLTISKRFAELLGGDITIAESQVGVGTRFRATVATGPIDGVKMISDPMAAT
ncbi:MAG: ATP-binding protein, partial [Actinomycetota bacterium]|nr:ATP-binding protein [Actinomycetota bacterium]